jgi:F420-dependent oxidoreductase-like protein
VRVNLMVEGQEGVTWPQWTALAGAAEEHGLDGLFRSDHYYSVEDHAGRGALDAWATLAALAAVTTRIRLGTLVSPVTFRHPSELAKVVLTVDHVSGGRAELGLGAGWWQAEHERYGFRFPDVGERFDILAEQLEIVHRSWGEGPFSFSGAHYRVEGLDALPKPVARPHPRLIMGGGAKRRAAALAARWADEYNFVYVGPEAVRAGAERLREAWRDAGRDVATLELSLMTACVVGRDAGEFEERARVLAERRGHGTGGGAASLRDDLGPSALLGTVEEVVAELEPYRAVGVGRVMLQHLLHDDIDAVAVLGDVARRLAG